jgi:hypothetical protein
VLEQDTTKAHLDPVVASPQRIVGLIGSALSVVVSNLC